MGVGKQTSTMAALGEVGEIPLAFHGYAAMLNYWHRTHMLDNNTLVKKAFHENVRLNSNWCRTIQVLTTTLNLDNKSYTRHQYTKIVKQNIQQKFNRYWKNRINNREVEHKLELYSKIKTKFEVEPYLSLPYFKGRQVISKFRCSNHNLET